MSTRAALPSNPPRSSSSMSIVSPYCAAARRGALADPKLLLSRTERKKSVRDRVIGWSGAEDGPAAGWYGFMVEGAMVVDDDNEVAESRRVLRNHSSVMTPCKPAVTVVHGLFFFSLSRVCCSLFFFRLVLHGQSGQQDLCTTAQVTAAPMSGFISGGGVDCGPTSALKNVGNQLERDYGVQRVGWSVSPLTRRTGFHPSRRQDPARGRVR